MSFGGTRGRNSRRSGNRRGRQQPNIGYSGRGVSYSSRPDDRNDWSITDDSEDIIRHLQSLNIHSSIRAAATTRPRIQVRPPDRDHRSDQPVRRHISEEEVDEYVRRIVNTITPSESEACNKRDIGRRLEPLVRRVLPNASLKVMGGLANTFALKDSDLDLCIAGCDLFYGDISFSRKLEMELRMAGKTPPFCLCLSSTSLSSSGLSFGRVCSSASPSCIRSTHQT